MEGVGAGNKGRVVEGQGRWWGVSVASNELSFCVDIHNTPELRDKKLAKHCISALEKLCLSGSQVGKYYIRLLLLCVI